MNLSEELLAVIVCPDCHGDLSPVDTADGGELVDVARRAREVLATFADGRQQVRNQVLSAVHDGAATFDLALSVMPLRRTRLPLRALFEARVRVAGVLGR